MAVGGAVRFIESRLLSRRRVATLLLAGVIALASGSVMAAAAGSRRASTSYDRFLRWSHGSDAVTGGMAVDSSEEADSVLTKAAQLPQVEFATRTMLAGSGIRLGDGRVFTLPTVFPVSIDLRHPANGRLKVLHGVLPDEAAVDQAAVSFVTAELLGLHVGDRVDVLLDIEADPPKVEPVRITAIGATNGDFPGLTGRPTQLIALTPAFLGAHPELVDWTNGGLILRLRGGTRAIEAFRSAVRDAGLPFDHIASASDDTGARRLVTVEARALWLLGAILGGAALVVLVQLFRRNASLVADQLRIAGQMGMPRRDLVAAGALGGLRVGGLGAVVGVMVAVGASRFLPVGVSRTAEPHIGFHADLVVLGLGAVAALLVAAAAGGRAVQLATRARPALPRRASRTAAAVSRLGPVSAVGARMALGVPARSTGGTTGGSTGGGLVGVIAALTALVGTLALGASFDRVLSDPRLSGATWDLAMVFEQPDARAEAGRALAREPAVAAFGLGGWRALTVNGRSVYGMIFDAGSGIAPAVDRGHPPMGAAEIALGAKELTALHVSIGDTVKVGLQQNDQPSAEDAAGPFASAVVTGRSVLASPTYQTLTVGEGGAISTSLFDRIRPSPDVQVPSYFVRLRDRSRLMASYTDLIARLHPDFPFARADNAGVHSLRKITTLVHALLVLLALLTVAALLYRVVATSRRQKVHMATMRSLGFTPSQLRRSQILHGVLVAALAVLVAVPAGIIATRTSWRRIADYLGVVSRPIVSPAASTGIVAATLLTGALVGLAVGVRYRRVAPGAALRAE